MSANFSAALSFSECKELLNLNLTGNSDSNNVMEVDDWEDMKTWNFAHLLVMKDSFKAMLGGKPFSMKSLME